MDYPSGHREAVYMNDYCRYVFSLPENLYISRQKSIRLVVRRHAVVVANFTEHKLVEILHYLIGQGVFRYPSAAAQEFPNLREAGITIGVQSPADISIENRLPESQTHEMTTIDLSWLRDSFDDNSYSDLILVSRGRQYNAHRAIVCPQSPVIAKKCKFQDATQGGTLCDTCGASPGYYFDFLDDDPQAVDCLIQYFYQQDYQSSCNSPRVKDAESCDAEHEVSVSLSEQDDIDDSYPILHVRVYALAELYGILTLKRLALEKFNKTIRENVQTHRFLASVEEAYTSTVQEDRGLRDAITEFFYTHPDLLDEERVQHTLRRTENLSFDIVMYWHHDHQTPKKAVPIWGYPVAS
ncbi:uncharacterized protein FPRO_14761 [Fusarium proliferatum ET1]|uniref:BTB domain-containing protein n=1 Tax=Fusarium proliferatum (strain ET1) TaxID=1227346 RepID=A0A1L7WB01_FUSPR|nr:uncharacterized protein FPRO_14761 [Fusarium proliferatum ET1]CZR49762.1 uncharacterized protein FPRO_14761 [Fusarium proliferatum ET1]